MNGGFMNGIKNKLLFLLRCMAVVLICLACVAGLSLLGIVRPATQGSDAMVLQYYEEDDAKEAAFGNDLSRKEWKAADGREYWSAGLVCQTTEQLRDLELLDENDHPAIYPVSLEGVSKNNDGLYTEKAFEKRLNDAVKEYDRLNEGGSAL